MNKKYIWLLCIISLFSFHLFAQNAALAERYLTAAKNSYSQENYSKAFEYINFVYNQYPKDEVPQEVVTLAEDIYFSYLNQAINSDDEEAKARIEEKLNDNPALKTKRINDLLKKTAVFSQQEEVTDNSGRVENTRSERNNYFPINNNAANNAKNAEYQKKIAELEAQLKEARALNEKDREQEIKMQMEMYERFISRNSSNALFIFVISVCIIGIIACAVILVITVIRKALKTVQHQQEQFESTLQMVAQLARTQNELSKSLKIANMNAYEICNATEPLFLNNDLTQEEIDEIKHLSEECHTLSEKIDKVTDRKNHSVNVADIMLKICNEMKMSQREGMLFYCAGLIYDIGFLQLDENLLKSTTLTQEDKYLIRGHVGEGVYMINFIPEKYRNIFRDAILNHHENMDGTGYPAGLNGERIPKVARMIHVVESYVALVSRRNYHGIMDKETAIQLLRSEEKKYDQEIVNIMDSIL